MRMLRVLLAALVLAMPFLALMGPRMEGLDQVVLTTHPQRSLRSQELVTITLKVKHPREFFCPDFLIRAGSAAQNDWPLSSTASGDCPETNEDMVEVTRYFNLAEGVWDVEGEVAQGGKRIKRATKVYVGLQ